MYKFYKTVTFLIIPILLINILFRILINKEDKKRIKERFGLTNHPKPLNKKVIWIHAASIGEFKSCDFIINQYHQSHCLLITTTTKTAAEYAIKNYGDKIIHQYAPFDITTWINSFIKKWKPKLVIWVESDLWPNTIINIKKHNIKSIFLNARISPKSFNNWKLFSSFYKYILKSFSYIFAQSINDLKRMQVLTNIEIQYIGNLKLTFKKPHISKIKINENITIMIGSTHKDEEDLIVPLLIKTYDEFKNIKFYIAPRHPDRANIIQKLLKNYKINACFESQFEKDINTFTIIDSFGKMEEYFAISDIVILGGSFTNNGGHNPIEPARAGCAILSGPNVFNWQNLYDDMVKANACYKLIKAEEIAMYLKKLITDKQLLKTYKQNALEFSNQIFFDQKKLLEIINKNLENYA